MALKETTCTGAVAFTIEPLRSAFRSPGSLDQAPTSCKTSPAFITNATTSPPLLASIPGPAATHGPSAGPDESSTPQLEASCTLTAVPSFVAVIAAPPGTEPQPVP